MRTESIAHVLGNARRLRNGWLAMSFLKRDIEEWLSRA
jgi:hypothetical protein